MGCDNWYDSWDCATKSLSNNVSSAVNTLSRGDIAKVIGNQTNALKNIISAPAEATLDLIKGDTKSAGSRFVKSAGSVAYIASPGADLWATEGGQKALRSTKVLSNMAGYNMAVAQTRDTGTTTNQYRDEAIRFGAEAAVIGGGVYAYNNPVIPTFSEAGAVSGKELVMGFSNPFTTNTLLGASAVKSLTNGGNPLKEVTKEILGNDIADIIFPNPTQPVQSNPSDPAEFGPWQNPEFTGSSPTTSLNNSSNLKTYLVIGVGILIVAAVLKKVG